MQPKRQPRRRRCCIRRYSFITSRAGLLPRHAHAIMRGNPASTSEVTSLNILDTARICLIRDACMQPTGRMHEANRACYAVVREELQTLFGALCRNKSADIVFATRKVCSSKATSVPRPSEYVRYVRERLARYVYAGRAVRLSLIFCMSSIRTRAVSVAE